MPTVVPTPSIKYAKTRWCFTLCSYDDSMYSKIVKFCTTTRVKYACIGKSTGLTGIPYLKGFIILTTPQRASHLKIKLSQRAHFVCPLDVKVNDELATECKTDGVFFEHGSYEREKHTHLATMIDLLWSRFRQVVNEHVERPSDFDIFLMFMSLHHSNDTEESSKKDDDSIDSKTADTKNIADDVTLAK